MTLFSFHLVLTLLLSQMRHPNIVSMLGYCKKGDILCLVTEFVAGGNLKNAIHDSSIDWSPSVQMEVALSIVRGMVYIHSRNIIHVCISW